MSNSFLYFAYGSNLWPDQVRSRCPSAETVGVGSLPGWSRVYDKPSADGSAKANIRPSADSEVWGAIYRIPEGERSLLDAAEPGYEPIEVSVDGSDALTYAWTGEGSRDLPYDWYAAMVVKGARNHGIGVENPPFRPDPIAPGILPVSTEDIPRMQDVLSESMTATDGRYSIHPGEIYWWYHHAHGTNSRLTSWMVDGGLVVIEENAKEVGVFARPGVDRLGLLEWAQRRLGGAGEIGFVNDEDQELNGHLESGYERVHSEPSYEFDLTAGSIPDPDLPVGWVIRPIEGEHEAYARREASHASFESSMDPDVHHERYIRFMRSPGYRMERDLVAVSPDGRIASFMIWWADERTGIAQIEPFGTHPEFSRRGIGRALINDGLQRMRREGMTLARVSTDFDRVPATAFYKGVGFAQVGAVHFWAPV